MLLSLRWNPPLETKTQKWAALVASGQYESMRRLADDVNDTLLQWLKDAAPKRSGAYAESIRGERSTEGKVQRITFTAASPLSTWIIYGTAPHPIDPVNAKVLRFTVGDGKVVFAQHVDHPGTLPNDYRSVALTSAMPDLNERLSIAGRELMQELRQ